MPCVRRAGRCGLTSGPSVWLAAGGGSRFWPPLRSKPAPIDARHAARRKTRLKLKPPLATNAQPKKSLHIHTTAKQRHNISYTISVIRACCCRTAAACAPGSWRKMQRSIRCGSAHTPEPQARRSAATKRSSRKIQFATWLKRLTACATATLPSNARDPSAHVRHAAAGC